MKTRSACSLSLSKEVQGKKLIQRCVQMTLSGISILHPGGSWGGIGRQGIINNSLKTHFFQLHDKVISRYVFKKAAISIWQHIFPDIQCFSPFPSHTKVGIVAVSLLKSTIQLLQIRSRNFRNYLPSTLYILKVFCVTGIRSRYFH